MNISDRLESRFLFITMHDSHDEAKIQESLNRFILYCQSSQINFRNLVGSTALETLPIVASSPKDVATVLELLSTVAVDPEVDVRCNVLEYIVHIALMLSDPNKSCETLRSFITSHVLPIIVTALLDVNPKVVKLADSSLIVLLEHCLVPNGYVQERIWPAIIKKMYDDPLTDSIVRVITLMSKMVPWVGCDTTETLFVPLFKQLCSYPEIIPRKACASIIGDFCAVVSLNTVETKLVPSFLGLCGDAVWVVRKACAEVFSSVSSAGGARTRKRALAPAFARLLSDPHHLVRSAAFQSLGPFITTFAEPSITNLGYNHQGKLVLRHPDGYEFQLNANIELNMTERMSLSELDVGFLPDDYLTDEELISFYEWRDHKKTNTSNQAYKDMSESELPSAKESLGCSSSSDNSLYRDEFNDKSEFSSHSAEKALEDSELSDTSQDIKSARLEIINIKDSGEESDEKLPDDMNSMEPHKLSWSYGKKEEEVSLEGESNSESTEQEEKNSSDPPERDDKNCLDHLKKLENLSELHERNESEKKGDNSDQHFLEREDKNAMCSEKCETTNIEHQESTLLPKIEKDYLESSSDEKKLALKGNNTLEEQESFGGNEPSSESIRLEPAKSSETSESPTKTTPEPKPDQEKESKLNEDNFSGFLFWRDPIPDIEIDLSLERKEAAQQSKPSFPDEMTVSDRLLRVIHNYEKGKAKKAEAIHLKPLLPISKISHSSDPSFFFARLQKFDTSKDRRFLDGVGRCPDSESDSLVPDELINHFVSMSSPRQDKLQNELAHHCAYNLPAVALTLGPANWALIKQACNALATDQQWRVRKIVASSIHELAVIVGSEVATEDLVPVFTGFIKDLDEVRIGALKHLANFLKLLKPAGRNSFLPRLAEFLITDYEWNWRFRAELAQQLLQIIRLFSPQDISVHVAPVVFTLLQDKVAYVRNITLQLVVEVMRGVAGEGPVVRSAVAELAEQFAHSARWARRQTFARLCSRLAADRALPVDVFARDILPHLLDLSWDKVPNVRLSVAASLSRHIMAIDAFSNPSSPHYEIVVVVLKRLQSDKDRDVRHFATLLPQASSETKTPAQLPDGSTVDSNKVAEAHQFSLR